MNENHPALYLSLMIYSSMTTTLTMYKGRCPVVDKRIYSIQAKYEITKI